MDKEYTMSMYASKDHMLADMRKDLEDLRAELQAEREHADRLAAALDHMGDYFWDRSCDAALDAHTERRKK